jgi:MFS family permease
MPSYWGYAVTLVFVGFAVVTMLTTANGYVQTTTDPALRGRVMALYVAVIMGGTPVGAPIVGWVAAQFGPRIAILVGAVAGFVAFAIGVTWLLASGRVHRHETRRFAISLDATRPLEIIRPAPEEFGDTAAGTTPIRLPPVDARRDRLKAPAAAPIARADAPVDAPRHAHDGAPTDASADPAREMLRPRANAG